MAKLPLPIEQIVEGYGPHPRHMTPRYQGEPDKMVADSLLFLRPAMRHYPESQR